MGVSVQSLTTVEEAPTGYKINIYTIIHGFCPSGVVSVIALRQICVRCRNCRDLLVRSLENRVEQNIGCEVTRIPVQYPLLRLFGPQRATTDGVNCC